MERDRGSRALLPAVPLGLVLSLAIGGCGPGGATHDAGPHDADFRICVAPDAGPFMAGLVETSQGGAFTATLASLTTTSSDAPPVDAPAVGQGTFIVSIVDGEGAIPQGLTVTAEKPYMPVHRHSAQTFPTVTDEGDGTFTVSAISFFMSGDFQVTLDLQQAPSPADGGAADGGEADGATVAPTAVADKVVFPICVPE